MTEHVCLKHNEIETLKKENEKLGKEISQIRNDHTDTRENMVEIKTDLRYLKETMTTMKTLVEKMADEPRKKWEQLQKQVMSFVVGGGLMGLLLWAGYTIQNFKK
jgi:septal ring factor EnvC (AmiA/AmiB activator)